MSFILDALRKSENKRHIQDSDTVRAVYESPTPKTQKTRRWVILLGLVLLLNLVLVVWMTSFHRSVPLELPIVQSPAPALTPATTDRPSVPIGVTSEIEVVESAQDAAPEEPALSANIATESESRPVEVAVATQPAAPEMSSAPTQTESIENLVAIENPAASNKLYSLSELPPSLRSRISALQMPLHAYNANNPAASMVQIDGRLLRAGGQIADDLRVEEITAEGVVLRSGTYRFLLPRRGQ